MLLRGIAKLVAVVVAAGLAGAFIGVSLAKLPGDDDSIDPALTVTASTPGTSTSSRTTPRTTSTATTTTTTPRTTTTPTTTTGTAVRVYRVPRVQVLSAQLTTAPSGGGSVTVKVRVTNRGIGPLTIATPVLVSRTDEVRLDTARAQARPLLRALDPGSRATGTLRFTTSPAMTQRLVASPAARLRIARRTILVKLTVATPQSP